MECIAFVLMFASIELAIAFVALRFILELAVYVALRLF